MKEITSGNADTDSNSERYKITGSRVLVRTTQALGIWNTLKLASYTKEALAKEMSALGLLQKTVEAALAEAESLLTARGLAFGRQLTPEEIERSNRIAKGIVDPADPSLRLGGFSNYSREAVKIPEMETLLIPLDELDFESANLKRDKIAYDEQVAIPPSERIITPKRLKGRKEHINSEERQIKNIKEILRNTCRCEYLGDVMQLSEMDLRAAGLNKKAIDLIKLALHAHNTHLYKRLSEEQKIAFEQSKTHLKTKKTTDNVPED